jgi:hypothetical protein
LSYFGERWALAWPVKKLGLTRFLDVATLFLFRSRFQPFVAQGCDVVKAIQEYRSPAHKITALLKKGRDDLRVKYRELMEQRRTAESQVRAVEKSRSMWRARAEAAESELREFKKRRTVPDRRSGSPQESRSSNILVACPH